MLHVRRLGTSEEENLRSPCMTECSTQSRISDLASTPTQKQLVSIFTEAPNLH